MTEAEKKLMKKIQEIQQTIEDTVTQIAYKQDSVQRYNNEKKKLTMALEVLRELK
tara:strand:- start:4702 stop:4866 length:165 start_codon:yes stop_codon:yes gene_type:complete